jgi:integrase
MPLYKRPGSPFWWIRIGRKTRKSTGTADRKQAEEFERTLIQRTWRREKLGDRGAVSWREVAERWLRDSKRERKRDREFLQWLDPIIGDAPVAEVADPDVLEELRQHGLEKGWKHSTVDRMMRTVRSVLKKCPTWRLLESAPHVPMYGGEDDTEPRFLTVEQFNRLKGELPPHLKVAAEFAVLTLLRMRSQSYLTWDRIDLDQQRAWIPGAQMKMHRTHGFPLSGKAVKVLRRARELSPTGERVFQYDGRPVDDFNRAAFKKAVARAGVGPLRWHDLRHTGASWAVQNGVTLQELQVLGDWKSYRSVLRYAHLAPHNAITAAESVAQWAHTGERRTKAQSAQKPAETVV